MIWLIRPSENSLKMLLILIYGFKKLTGTKVTLLTGPSKYSWIQETGLIAITTVNDAKTYDSLMKASASNIFKGDTVSGNDIGESFSDELDWG
ncbi:hypothetical protein PPL_05211 [Heterostelium album PN500]|uniref:Uncharacterized protein n=1 Tax=Heterostelium pallidum (strain ATCC 26659 / Pp 5 / PN500) TaxID=670386 RepID=D3B9R5_HETP5|nr:hypothetical protein PPL_05211 [Heterostelium album PN500]EFA81977.1 hypothetical protein PPL_05211 [Heterostelium album PN500]|eukprot:XP_020434094.1 hypothetical protein PPL_05211 [Heterostelium album PN500]